MEVSCALRASPLRGRVGGGGAGGDYVTTIYGSTVCISAVHSVCVWGGEGRGWGGSDGELVMQQETRTQPISMPSPFFEPSCNKIINDRS